MVMAVEENDWESLEKYLARDHVVAVGLGIHPWKAQKVSPDWKERLQNQLVHHREILVGEIGLDKVAKTRETGKVEWDAQVRVFEEQMEIATSLQRPVSMHCVKAHGHVYEYLRQHKKRPSSSSSSSSSSCYPSAISFHSYTGSVEMASSLLKLPEIGQSIYFGFSASVNLKNSSMQEKFNEIIRHLPQGRILMESDLDQEEAIANGMEQICEALAQGLKMEKDDVIKLCNQNAFRFVGR